VAVSSSKMQNRSSSVSRSASDFSLAVAVQSCSYGSDAAMTGLTVSSALSLLSAVAVDVVISLLPASINHTALVKSSSIY